MQMALMGGIEGAAEQADAPLRQMAEAGNFQGRTSLKGCAY
jgi:hypothetical protein